MRLIFDFGNDSRITIKQMNNFAKKINKEIYDIRIKRNSSIDLIIQKKETLRNICNELNVKWQKEVPKNFMFPNGNNEDKGYTFIKKKTKQSLS